MDFLGKQQVQLWIFVEYTNCNDGILWNTTNAYMDICGIDQQYLSIKPQLQYIVGTLVQP